MILALLLSCHAPPQSVHNSGAFCAQSASRRPSSGSAAAAQLARRLGRAESLLIGLGNDLEGGAPEDAGIATLPAALDLHYTYLTGLPGPGSWTHWNPSATFIDRFIEAASARCQVPMFTLYAMASRGENNMAVLAQADFMDEWWAGLSLALSRIAAADEPVLLHIEPDFWGFAQQHTGGDPAAMPVRLPEDCTDLRADLTGMGRCIARRVRQQAPLVSYGLHASPWSGSADQTAAFLADIGPGDLLFTETLDRDAGCFEAGRSPHCQRDDGPWYWSDADLKAHLAWAGALSQQTGRPLMWWQMPLGRPDRRAGGEGRYRDNRVQLVFEHPEKFVAAGGIGVVFGKGAPGQTGIDTDRGQFAEATARYYAAPTPLP